MATKKKSGKIRTKALATDPPILVGGGGSSFIWIKKELDPQLIQPADVPASAPQPLTPDKYYCFKVQGNVTKINVDDGGGAGGGKPANGKKYNVQFDF